jgi:hypothetical protein
VRQTSMKRLTRDEARRIATNIETPTAAICRPSPPRQMQADTPWLQFHQQCNRLYHRPSSYA